MSDWIEAHNYQICDNDHINLVLNFKWSKMII